MRSSNLTKLTKNFFFFILFIFVLIYWVITYPFYYIKKETFGRKCINSLFMFINDFYGCRINQSDYLVDNNLPDSSEIERKCNNLLLARSRQVEKFICFKIFVDDNKDLIGYPVIHNINRSLNLLSKLFEIEQSISIYFKNYKIYNIKLDLKMNHHLFHTIEILFFIEISSTLDIVSIRKIMPNRRIETLYDDMPFSDVALLLYLSFLSQHDEINTLLPEIRTPSAYNFQSEDFRQRLILAEMLDY